MQPKAETKRRSRWWGQVRVAGVLSVLAALTAGHAGAEIAFHTVQEIVVGSAPAAIARVGDEVLVGGDDGITRLRGGADGLAITGRITAVRFVKHLAVADVTADGQPDLLCADGHATRVRLLTRDTRGGWDPPRDTDIGSRVRVLRAGVPGTGHPVLVGHDAGLAALGANATGLRALAAGWSISDLAALDLASDDHVELVVTDAGRRRLVILAPTPDGSFAEVAALGGVSEPRALLAADANGDGHPDLFVVDASGLALHLRDPSARAADPATALLPGLQLSSAPHLVALAAADVNRDGHLDVAAVDRSRGTVAFFLGAGDGRFAAGGTYAVGRGPRAVLLTDVTGDATLDALTVNELSDSVTLLRGLGGGEFAGSRAVPTDAADLTAVTAADFNADGHLDLALLSERDATVHLLLGDGHGRFAPRAAQRVGQQPRGLIVAPLGPAATPALLTADYAADGVYVLHDDGAGGLHTARRLDVGNGPTAIVAADFQGTGGTDLAVANALSGDLSIFYGDAAGAFSRRVDVPLDLAPTFLFVGDHNQDGRPDLLAGNPRTETVAVLYNTGTELGAPTTDHLGDTPRPSLADDLDRDGEIDLAITNDATDTLDILPGTPSGFGLPLHFAVGRDPTTVASGDFTEDGRSDLAVVHRDTATVSILVNASPAPGPPAPARRAGRRRR